MRRIQAISVTLPDDMLDMVRAKVAAGEYASESEVVRDGLRALWARDAAVEKWLQEEVAVEHAAYLKDPSDILSAEDVFARLRDGYARPDAKDR
jgi:putative addiction module CopG family antidote